MSWQPVAKKIALFCIQVATKAIANEIEQKITNVPKTPQKNQSPQSNPKVSNILKLIAGGK